ncbi:MAG: DUF2092 domain-containing protein [Candidatus Binatia bacterium]
MSRIDFTPCAAALGLAAVLAGCTPVQPAKPARPAAAPAAAPTPVLQPAALELLQTMSATLAAARTMSFTATTTYESPSRLGPPISYTTVAKVTLQRPDKLRVLTPGDGPASEFYDDGRTMMAYAPAENLVAIADAPPTIDAALKMAYDRAAIYFPFTDVVVADPYTDLADGLTVAFVIGQSKVVGGTTTNMVAVANDRVFMQIWIGADDHLPRRIKAVYAGDPSRLRHQVDLSDWRLDGPVTAASFTSARAAAARRMPFAAPAAKPPPTPAATPAP